MNEGYRFLMKCMFFFVFSFLFKVIFPNAQVIKLLLECGINVNAKNEVKSTPLHIAAQPYNFNNEVSGKFLK